MSVVVQQAEAMRDWSNNIAQLGYFREQCDARLRGDARMAALADLDAQIEELTQSPPALPGSEPVSE